MILSPSSPAGTTVSKPRASGDDPTRGRGHTYLIL